MDFGVSYFLTNPWILVEPIVIGKWLIFQFGPFSTPNKANLLEVQTLWLRNSVWSVRFLWLGWWSPAWKCLLDGLLTCHIWGWSHINLLLKSSYHWQHVQMDHFCDIQKGFMPLMHLADTMSTAAWGLSAHPWPSPVVCTEDAMVSPKSWNASGLGPEIFGRLGLWIGKFIDTLGLPWSVMPPQFFALDLFILASHYSSYWTLTLVPNRIRVLYRCVYPVYPSGPSTQVYHKLSTSAHKHGWGLRDVVTRDSAKWSEQLRRQSIHWLPLFMYFYVANPTRNHLQFGVIPLYIIYIYMHIYVHTYTGWWFGTFFIFYICIYIYWE